MTQRTGKPFRKTHSRRPPAESPRLTALRVLQDVSQGGAYASLALGERLRASKLDRRDRDLVTELVYGTLQRQIALDYLLGHYMARPVEDALAQDILRMGAYQVLYLTRVPDRAAVDESVKAAHTLGRGALSGLINAVLRNLAREKDSLPWPDQTEDPVRFLSVRHSLPVWIAERLAAAYGLEEAQAIAAYEPDERSVTVRRSASRIAAADLERLMTEKGWDWKPGQLKNAYVVSGIGDIGRDPFFLQGLYSVQSESSMLAAMAVRPGRGQSVLDACAAPGGKAAFLAEAMLGTGRVYAWDIHEHRVELIRGMTRRLGLDNVRPAVYDATRVKENLVGTMDAVLVDAPCSGLGVMLQKPDVKLRQTPEGVAALVELQAALLDACCRYVKPGGTLVYATCTILPEENAEQVRAFLTRHPDFTPDDEGLRDALPAFTHARIRDGALQLQAHRDNMEGFFIARMKRVAP